MFLSCTTLYEWLSILFLVFVMHTSVRMTIHIFFGFCHAHLCTNNYPFLCVWFFVMHIYVRMTIHILFEWVFVMRISVPMTIHFFMGFRHAHFCTNDYPFHCVWIFVMRISVRRTICSQFISNAFLLNGNSEFLGVFSSNVSVSLCVQCSSTRE